MFKYYILKDKKVIGIDDVIEWGKEFGNSNRIIKQETLPDGNFVSTVFLGIDYNFSDKGKPLLFETMVFPQRGNYLDKYMERYSTYEEAEAGHKRIVEQFTN